MSPEPRYERVINNGVEEWQAELIAGGGALVELVVGNTLQTALTGAMIKAAILFPELIPLGAMIYAHGTLVNAQAASLAGDGTEVAIEKIITSDFWQDNVASDRGWTGLGSGEPVLVGCYDEAGIRCEISLSPSVKGFTATVESGPSNFDLNSFLRSLSENYAEAFHPIPAQGVEVTINKGGESLASYVGSESNNILSITNDVRLAILHGGDDWLGLNQTEVSIDGGNGNDTLSYFNYDQAVNIDLDSGNTLILDDNSVKDIFISIENAEGSDFNDKLNGNNVDNKLLGGLGNDTLAGNGGNNTLDGGEGQDKLYAGKGHNELYGGTENDYLQGGGGLSDLLYGGSGEDIFGLAHNSFVMDADYDDRIAWAGQKVDGGTQLWWMEGGWAYHTPTQSIVEAGGPAFYDALTVASAALDLRTSTFFRFGLSEGGQMIIQYARGKGGQAVIENYDLDLGTGAATGGVVAFRIQHVEDYRVTKEEYKELVNLAWKTAFGNGITGNDPILIDLDGDGIELTRERNSDVHFDFDADGFAEHTAWVKADDGILVRDLNSNGSIDDITELFGDANSDGITAALWVPANDNSPEMRMRVSGNYLG